MLIKTEARCPRCGYVVETSFDNPECCPGCRCFLKWDSHEDDEGYLYFEIIGAENNPFSGGLVLNNEKPEIIEVIGIVRRLNEELARISETENVVRLRVETDGVHFCIVKFLGNKIWVSYEDGRDYNGETGAFEPLEDYLKRERDRLIEFIGNHKYST